LKIGFLGAFYKIFYFLPFNITFEERKHFFDDHRKEIENIETF
jgi:hypothetical protein